MATVLAALLVNSMHLQTVKSLTQTIFSRINYEIFYGIKVEKPFKVISQHIIHAFYAIRVRKPLKEIPSQRMCSENSDFCCSTNDKRLIDNNVF